MVSRYGWRKGTGEGGKLKAGVESRGRMGPPHDNRY